MIKSVLLWLLTGMAAVCAYGQIRTQMDDDVKRDAAACQARINNKLGCSAAQVQSYAKLEAAPDKSILYLAFTFIAAAGAERARSTRNEAKEGSQPSV